MPRCVVCDEKVGLGAQIKWLPFLEKYGIVLCLKTCDPLFKKKGTDWLDEVGSEAIAQGNLVNQRRP